MPRISAPTVAEHRAAQRAALISATEQLLLDGGLAGVTPRTIAAHAGLARSSFYEYFPSRDDVLAAVAIAAFDRWAAEIDAVLAATPAPDRLRAFVESTIRMTADGKHEIASLLQQADLAPGRYEDVMALHETLMRPLATLLAESGAPEPEVYASLVQGLLSAGVQLVTHGVDPGSVTDRIVRILDGGIPAD